MATKQNDGSFFTNRDKKDIFNDEAKLREFVKGNTIAIQGTSDAVKFREIRDRANEERERLRELVNSQENPRIKQSLIREVSKAIGKTSGDMNSRRLAVSKYLDRTNDPDELIRLQDIVANKLGNEVATSTGLETGLKTIEDVVRLQGTNITDPNELLNNDLDPEELGQLSIGSVLQATGGIRSTAQPQAASLDESTSKSLGLGDIINQFNPVQSREIDAVKGLMSLLSGAGSFKSAQKDAKGVSDTLNFLKTGQSIEADTLQSELKKIETDFEKNVQKGVDPAEANKLRETKQRQFIKSQLSKGRNIQDIARIVLENEGQEVNEDSLEAMVNVLRNFT